MAAEFEVFLHLHKVQLTNLEIPERYWSNIHRKITEEVLMLQEIHNILNLM